MLGLDLYQQFNTVTSWPAVKAAGVQFVYVKLTDGGGRAIVAGDNYANGARGAGIKVGGYHYMEASPSPEQQADVFAAELKRLNALDIPPALDLEEPSIPVGSRIDFGQRFLKRLQANLNGARVAIYSSGSWFTALHPDTWGIPNLMDWEAEYGVNDGAEHPIRSYTGHVDVHQYTSVGHIAGITGNVDVDDAFVDITSSGGLLVSLTPAQEQTVLAAADAILPGQEGVRAAGSVYLTLYQIQQQLAALPAALQAVLQQEETDLLAAIKAQPAVSVDPAAVAKALSDAGLSQQVVSALLAVLAKAAA